MPPDIRSGPRQARRLVARGELSVGRPDLPARQSAAARAAERSEHVKPRLLGHWGTTPGLNFIYAHLNRVIKRRRPRHDLSSPGPAMAGRASSPTPGSKAPTARSIPTISQDEAGMQRLFQQFSFPGGIPSHAAPETPGSIHEGGELGYSLSHAYGAAFDNPGSDRRLRRRRRRGGDRAARDLLALQQVPQSGDATARCCRSCT